MHQLCVHAYLCVCVSASKCVSLTYDAGETSCGIVPCDHLVKVRVVKLQTLQKCNVRPLSFRVEDVEQTT